MLSVRLGSTLAKCKKVMRQDSDWLSHLQVAGYSIQIFDGDVYLTALNTTHVASVDIYR